LVCVLFESGRFGWPEDIEKRGYGNAFQLNRQADGPGRGGIARVIQHRVGGTDGFLTVKLTSGSWGQSPAAGTWAISPDFWAKYGEAVISIHVGNGGGDPNHA
jgi:hypothetical protein